MEQYFLAVDFGASSGRHILAKLEGGRICLREIYRFENHPVMRDGMMCWDLDYLTEQLLAGMKKCAGLHLFPASVGIDTWGLDYVLLDGKGARISPAVNHRDPRTAGIYQSIFEKVPEQELYARTGIQMAEFNTLCQLEALKRDSPDVFFRAGAMVMLPDYFNYLLTGKLVQEYSNASATQLIRAGMAEWDWELIRKMEFPESLFLPICSPGAFLGGLRKEIADQVGFSCDVILVPGHDTASAFLSLPPSDAGTLPAISSGTWSLMGMEVREPVITEQARDWGFTNEGSGAGRALLLKNSMGLWMIQNIRKEAAPFDSFAELCRKAEAARIDSVVDCGSSEFLAPPSMSKAVREYCKRSGQQIPESTGELAKVVYQSLAGSYAAILEQLKSLTGAGFECLRIIGGGSHAGYLNRLTAAKAGIPVYAGPAEATALGNSITQMTALGIFSSLDEARRCAAQSSELRVYKPGM